MERKDRIVADSRKGVGKWVEDSARAYRGHARFAGPDTVQVNGETLQGDRIFLDVGGRPRVPDMPGLGEVPYLTSESMMELTAPPGHLVIVGGSYVGLEFAQMMRRFGSRVTVIEQGPRLIAHEDEDVSVAVQEFLRAEGIEVRTGAPLRLREERAFRGLGRGRVHRGPSAHRGNTPAARRRARAQHRRPRTGQGGGGDG